MLWGVVKGRRMQAAEAHLPTELGSETDREKVREQMNRLLETNHFRNSRRYPALLRFIVEETLEGRGDALKERFLGVRVFDRPPDYDTATDPIVRVTIAEIRKRIAQYYHDEEHDAEIRIELLPGRYAPEFRTRREVPSSRPQAFGGAAAGVSVAAAGEGLVEAPVPAKAPAAEGTGRRSRTRWYVWGVAAALVLGLASASAVEWMRPTATEQLWGPTLRSTHSVLICLPTDVGRKRDATGALLPSPEQGSGSRAAAGNKAEMAPNPTFLDHESLGENVVYSDMLAALDMANVISSHHRDYRVRLTVSTTLDDLRYGPVIMVGGLDNQWTMRALAPLRFHFAGSDEDRYWIADSSRPSYRGWWLDLKQPYAMVTRDYAIIARLHNEQTDQPEVIVAGIGMSGTAAAGEFVADESRLKELRQRIGAGFKDRDFEIVLGTDVVNGIAGSPKILAVSVW